MVRTSTRGNTDACTLMDLLQTGLKGERKSAVEIAIPLLSPQELERKRRKQREIQQKTRRAAEPHRTQGERQRERARGRAREENILGAVARTFASRAVHSCRACECSGACDIRQEAARKVRGQQTRMEGNGTALAAATRHSSIGNRQNKRPSRGQREWREGDLMSQKKKPRSLR